MKPKRWLDLVTASVLGVSATGAAGEHAEHDFGPEVAIVRSLGLGGSMDATVEGDTLYVVGRSNLHVADI